jgi:hypothetical protein
LLRRLEKADGSRPSKRALETKMTQAERRREQEKEKRLARAKRDTKQSDTKRTQMQRLEEKKAQELLHMIKQKEQIANANRTIVVEGAKQKQTEHYQKVEEIRTKRQLVSLTEDEIPPEGKCLLAEEK